MVIFYNLFGVILIIEIQTKILSFNPYETKVWAKAFIVGLNILIQFK